MGRQSTVRRLPPKVLEALEGWLRDPAITQQETVRRTNLLLDEVAPEHPKVSRSAVGRYHAGFRETARRMKESREIARMMIADMGSLPGGRVGHVLTEIIRTVSFRLSRQIEGSEFDLEDLPGVIGQLKDLALISQRVERASRESERREREIREAAAEEAAEAAGSAARSQGLSRETADAIRREILGVGA
ncbi:MAG: DUF3486 family protein [Alphaproteobacteria bacterium]|nr:DUF3486 family protein [Alphaproteobacteria bacterium]